MKKTAALLCCLALLCVGSAFALPDSSEWTGEVLDLGCYQKGQKGPDHAKCAVRCLTNGSDMGLLVNGDVVYVDLEGSDAKAVETLKSLGGQNAKVTGTATTADEKTTVTVTKAEKAK